MRKKTLSNIADELFWFIVAILPILFYTGQFLYYKFDDPSVVIPSFYQFLSQFGVLTDSVIYTVMSDIFGNGGAFPLFDADSSILLYLSYFIIVMIVHVAVDVLLFIPRLSHKWLADFTCKL